MSTSQTDFSASQDVMVSVTISNPAGNSVRILKWFTPADGVEESLFRVMGNGELVSYTGAIYKSIFTAFDTAGVSFHCGCKQNYYAYVYPDQPYNTYLCRVFWSVPLSGTDSKAGTLIHEMSHYNGVASTNDFVYGQTGAKNLAITNPNDAINNADNHEYFAENTPPLP